MFLACAALVLGCGRGGNEMAEAVGEAERLLAAGKTTEAEQAYERIAGRWPDLARAHANLAYLRLKAGDAEGAVEKATRALEIEPELVAALTTLGGAYIRLGPEYEDKALSALEKAASFSGKPGAAEAKAALAAVYYRRRNLAAAIASARAALAADPSLGEAKYNLAVALEADAERKESVGRAEEARRLRGEALGHFRSFAEGKDSPEAEEARRASERLAPLVGEAASAAGTGAEPEP